VSFNVILFRFISFYFIYCYLKYIFIFFFFFFFQAEDGIRDRNVTGVQTCALPIYRLGRVGWKDDPHFEPGAFAAIYSASAGIPRRINTLCNRLLLGAYLAERHVLTAEDVEAIVSEVEDRKSVV